MTTRTIASRKAEEGIANAGAHDNQAPPQENQVLPLEQAATGYQVSVVPPRMTYWEIILDFLNLDHDMTSQANVITFQIQSMTAQMNGEV